MAQDDDGLIREVNEAYRQDQAKEWWDKFGSRVIAVTATIIGLTAGVVLYQNYEHSKQADLTAQFFEGYEHYQAGEYSAALQSFEELAAKDASEGAVALAKLYSAHSVMRLNEEPLEDNRFAEIAAEAPEPLAALAAIQSAYAGESNAPVEIAKAWFPAMVYQMELSEVIRGERTEMPVAPEQPASANIQGRIEVLQAVLESQQADAE